MIDLNILTTINKKQENKNIENTGAKNTPSNTQFNDKLDVSIRKYVGKRVEDKEIKTFTHAIEENIVKAIVMPIDEKAQEDILQALIALDKTVDNILEKLNSGSDEDNTEALEALMALYSSITLHKEETQIKTGIFTETILDNNSIIGEILRASENTEISNLEMASDIEIFNNLDNGITLNKQDIQKSFLSELSIANTITGDARENSDAKDINYLVSDILNKIENISNDEVKDTTLADLEKILNKENKNMPLDEYKKEEIQTIDNNFNISIKNNIEINTVTDTKETMHPVAKQILEAIINQVNNQEAQLEKITQLKIKLYPSKLGDITINIYNENNYLDIRIVTATAEAKDILQESFYSMNKAFEEANSNISIDISFSKSEDDKQYKNNNENSDKEQRISEENNIHRKTIETRSKILNVII